MTFDELQPCDMFEAENQVVMKVTTTKVLWMTGKDKGRLMLARPTPFQLLAERGDLVSLVFDAM
ncbi:hypothetical protein LCGC14_3117990 [marine sediment metagenome]|uniref:Uncharacterized protein n=1 Tax=marine sediment metagenome TaxID=412755 RepID=A0A0F8W329_9ZZZZ